MLYHLSWQVGKVESLQSRTHDPSWQKIETIPLTPSGSTEIHHEATILTLFGHRQTNGRSLDEDDLQVASDGLVVEKAENIRVRVKLCLMTDYDVCGDYAEAEGKLFFCLTKFTFTWSSCWVKLLKTNTAFTILHIIAFHCFVFEFQNSLLAYFSLCKIMNWKFEELGKYIRFMNQKFLNNTNVSFFSHFYNS